MEEVVDLLTGWTHLGHWYPEDKVGKGFIWAFWEARGVGSSPLTCCVTLSQHFPNCTPWEVTRVLLSETELLPKKRSDSIWSDGSGSSGSMPVGPFLTQSICGCEFLLVLLGKFSLG